jgi:hypothetical protein
MNEQEKVEVSEAPQGWFYQPANIRLLIIGLVVACLAAVGAQFLYTDDHPHFDVEKWYGFQAVFGFAAFVVVVMLGKILRIFVSRPEDYYDS